MSSICPRCEESKDMKHPALSRRYNIDICSGCGEIEAMMDFTHIHNIPFDMLSDEAKFCAKDSPDTYSKWLEWKNQKGDNYA